MRGVAVDSLAHHWQQLEIADDLEPVAQAGLRQPRQHFELSLEAVPAPDVEVERVLDEPQNRMDTADWFDRYWTAPPARPPYQAGPPHMPSGRPILGRRRVIIRLTTSPGNTMPAGSAPPRRGTISFRHVSIIALSRSPGYPGQP